jgi:hypothetical protein
MIIYGDEEEVDFKESVVGMIFDSIAGGLEYYKVYAKKKDFGVLKRTNHKRKMNYYQYMFFYNKYRKVEEKNYDKPSLPQRIALNVEQ